MELDERRDPPSARPAQAWLEAYVAQVIGAGARARLMAWVTCLSTKRVGVHLGLLPDAQPSEQLQTKLTNYGLV